MGQPLGIREVFCFDNSLIYGTVHVFYEVIVIDILLILTVCDGDVPMCGVEWVRRSASRFYCMYKHDVQV